MKKTRNAVFGMTFICALLGIIIGVQFKTVQSQNNNTLDNKRISDLTLELKKALEEKEALSVKVEEYEEKIKTYEDEVSDSDTSYNLIKNELENVKAMAGLTELTGEGIVVTLTENANMKSVAQSDAFLIHAEDILNVVNEMSVGGAKAIAINGQRIVATSPIRCAGSVVTVNGNKIAEPFEISALGDADVIEAALRFPGGVIDSLSPWGIDVSIKKVSDLTIPAYTYPITLNEYMKTNETGEE